MWTGCPGGWNQASLPVQLWWCSPHCFPARGWRAHLQGWPSPLLLALCASEDIRQQEKNLFYPRITAVIQSASRLWPSPPQMLVTPESISFLKVKVLLSHFQKWFRSPGIWFSDGKVRCDSDCMSCTWSLRKYLWFEEPRDQLDSGLDHADWSMYSPVYY